MALTPEAIYIQLGQLVSEMPDLATGPITPEMNAWMGRAAALVERLGDQGETITLRVSCQMLNSPHLRANNAQTIAAVVHRALAKAELNAPAGTRGAFIAAGDTLDAFAAVGKALAMARHGVLMVDPYADAKVLTDYAVQANENVTVRVLSDSASCYTASIKPAAEHWRRQFGALRPLEIRLTGPRALHDRLMELDGSQVFVLGQSFKDLAARAHTSLVRMDPDSAALKIAAYVDLWKAATPL